MKFSEVDVVVAATSLGYDEDDLNMTTANELVSWFIANTEDPHARLAAPGVRARAVVLQYILERNEAVSGSSGTKQRGGGKAKGSSDGDSD